MNNYQSIFFVATATWIAIVGYLAYMHMRVKNLEKKLRG